MRKSILALSLALAVATAAPASAGAVPGPSDSQVAVPARLSAPGGEAPAAWSLLGDPTLAALVGRAMQANTDVRQAVERLAMARARVGVARGDSLPQGEVSAARQGGDPSPPHWAGSVGLAWELDLFGRLAQRRAAARAGEQQEQAALEAVRLAIASDVARTWFELLGARETLVLRSSAAADQAEIVALAVARVEAGTAAPGDLARARAEAAAEDAAVRQARDAAFALEARLAVLLGEVPGAWRAPPAESLAALQLAPLALPSPEALLQARPDVRAAERALAARAADARAAAAARFPRLQLAGVLGFLAGDLGALFSGDPDSRLQSAGLGWPLFSLPRLQAQTQEARAGARLALAAYDQAVLVAIEEAEVALQRHGSASEQARLRLESAAQSAVAAEAALARYEEGAAPYLDALVARRDALARRLAAVEALVGQRVAVIDVLRAFGTAPLADPPARE